MANKEILFQILNIVAVSGYALKCPANAEWRLRAKVSCSSEDKYVCLFHLLEKKYQDDCLKSDLSSIGSNLVFQPLFNIAKCKIDRYQPIVFTTYGNSECIMLKSKCDDEGQILHNRGSPSTDTACRCDYTKGYAFISSPANRCFCIPSEEDCSCFRVTCVKLSPDYRCIAHGEMIAKPTCQEIPPQISYNKNNQTFQDIENNITLISGFSYAHQVAVIINVCLAVFIVTTTFSFFLVGEHRHHFASNIVFGKHAVDENKELSEIVCQLGKKKNVTLSRSTDGKLVENYDTVDIQSRWSQYVEISLLESETRLIETLPDASNVLSYGPDGSPITCVKMDNNRLSVHGVYDGRSCVSDQHQLIINFPQPSSDDELFMCLLEKNCVSLEKVIISDNKVFGTIKVKNIVYEKKVFVRVTFNDWSDFFDIECVYFPNESTFNDGIDTFNFEFNVPMELDLDSIIEFAVCFDIETQKYWDNRNGKNYQIKFCSDVVT
ncbi:PPP1R3 [Mytilus coruscus]|uniref:PPP1R3 n=1 Tax=Mytilus coruscus TaxID=42192 RepID=A0A6J8DUI3_MYTCO|nr:PPP1R3 [Mytilus coruscus]